MSSWNYRVICKKTPFNGEIFYEIHEVYYKEDGTIEDWTSDAVIPYGENPHELMTDVNNMCSAFLKPILHVTEDNLLEEM